MIKASHFCIDAVVKGSYILKISEITKKLSLTAGTDISLYEYHIRNAVTSRKMHKCQENVNFEIKQHAVLLMQNNKYIR